ncbi:PDZ domain-containing protein [Lysobacter brunescens]|uniref:PDZ domain-containing protein n=1 Tax=Lysobacter brunescens TaxID=262323 RepID=A0ABW2YAU6_9GAMM
MTTLRTSLTTLALACMLAPAFAASAQSTTGAKPAGPTPEQRKELDAARDELQRAAKRLAELSSRYGGAGFGGAGFDMETFAPSRPVVGVLLAPEPQGGVRISGVTPGGAAANAGLRSGDRLLRVNGKAINGDSAEARVDGARALLQDLDEKTPVKLTFARDGREQEVSVTPKRDARVMVFSSDGKQPGERVVIRRIGDGKLDIDGETIDLPGFAERAGKAGTSQVFAFAHGDEAGPNIERRVIRIECKDGKGDCATRLGADGGTREIRSISVGAPCKPGEDCKGGHLLAEAFRWSGLNLASVDAQLGRYFGTDKGVLVLSAGPVLDTLQPGDVILRVDGKAVATPREVMDALRGKPADSTVPVDYLRDRAPGSAKIKVPDQARLPAFGAVDVGAIDIGAIDLDIDALRAMPGARVQRHVMMVDKDGKVTTFQDGDKADDKAE